MQLFKVVEDVFQNPPIPHEPAKQSLKAWAMYCLRNRGFIVVYAQNADFAVEVRGGEKVYFKVAQDDAQPEPKVAWIVWDSATQITRLIPPQEA